MLEKNQQKNNWQKRIIDRKKHGTISPAGEKSYYKIKKEFEVPDDDENVVIIENSSELNSAYKNLIKIIQKYVECGDR